MTKCGHHYIKRFTMIFFAIFIVGYGLFNFRIFINGPEINIKSPSNGTSSDDGLIQIEGSATHTSFITINDRSILVNENNEFKEPVMLSPGYNMITIKARDQFEREISQKIEIVFNGNLAEASTLLNASSTELIAPEEASSTAETVPFEENTASSSDD